MDPPSDELEWEWGPVPLPAPAAPGGTPPPPPPAAAAAAPEGTGSSGGSGPLPSQPGPSPTPPAAAGRSQGRGKGKQQQQQHQREEACAAPAAPPAPATAPSRQRGKRKQPASQDAADRAPPPSSGASTALPDAAGASGGGGGGGIPAPKRQRQRGSPVPAEEVSAKPTAAPKSRSPVGGDEADPGAAPPRQTVTNSMNGHPFVVHRGTDVFLAATPLRPTALSVMFSHLHKHKHVVDTDEDWDPLVKAICQEEGVPGWDTPPGCVVRLKLREDCYKIFRAKQIELQEPYNVWYSPRHDTRTPVLNLQLKPTVCLHSHQSQALCRVARHGFAGSGCVVLPCGSGKTLTGIALACQINRATLIVCNSLTSVAQWQAAIGQFCNTSPGFAMEVFSLKHKVPTECRLVLTTYSILASDRGMAAKSNMGRLTLETKTWGLILLDEVHCVPTATFQKALARLRAKCILGLTATPLREDSKLGHLPFLISPVTFFEEESWERLTNEGFLAKVQCVEVMCSQDESCTKQLEKAKSSRLGAVKRELIVTANPAKLRCCQALMMFHESQGDKVLVFCDSIYVLSFLGTSLMRPVIQGSTKDDTKIEILNEFRMSQGGSTILFSRVGDTSIDLPEANVIIEVGAHFGSRCQETQRFGRVSRPKASHPEADPDGPQAYFYSLLTSGTDEVKFGQRRRMFLLEKGYNFAAVSGEDILAHHTRSDAGQLILSTDDEKEAMYEGALKAKPQRKEKAP